QAVVMAEGARITARDLRLHDAGVSLQTLGEARLEGERVAIERALVRNGGHLQAAARDLGISRVTLYRLMNRHGLRGGADEAGTAWALPRLEGRRTQPAAIVRTTSGSGVGRPLARSIQTITTWPSACSTAPSALVMRWPSVTLLVPTRSAVSSTTIEPG